MKPIQCVLGLLIFSLVFFACSTDNDDDSNAVGPIDDDNDDTADDDNTNSDDDSQPEGERVIYGFYTDSFQDPHGEIYSHLSIYHFNGFEWDTPVDAEEDYLAADIWGADAEQVFVVGHSLKTDLAMYYHYDGTKWLRHNIVESFGRFYVSYLTSVFGSSPTDVYALGHKTNAWYADKGMIILYYDGQDWNGSYIPDESIGLFELWCAPTGEAFAVGDWYNAGSYTGYLVVHNDSGTWEETRFPDPNCALYSVWGTAADDVFVAGGCNEITGDDEFHTRVLVLHYDGDQWQEIDTDGMEDLHVEDISGTSGHEVYLAANTYANKGVSRPRIYFFDGSNWSEQQYINQAIWDHGLINSIWATSSSELYIVDGYLDIYDHHAGTIQTIESPPLTRVWAPASE